MEKSSKQVPDVKLDSWVWENIEYLELRTGNLKRQTNQPYRDQVAGSWEIQVLKKNGREG